MRRGQWLIHFCAYSVCGLLVVLLPPHLSIPQTADTITFLWAFGSRVGPTATKAPGPLTQKTVLHTGDQFKMLVQLQQPCFVYVLSYSDEQGVNLLFPSTMQQFETDYVLGKRYEIPPNEAWYTLTPPAGRETIYVLASTTHLTVLEALLGAAATATPTERPSLTARLLAEIRAPRPGRPVATAGERPVHISGNIRGTPDLGDFAVEIHAHTFYRKTFIIEHR